MPNFFRPAPQKRVLKTLPVEIIYRSSEKEFDVTMCLKNGEVTFGWWRVGGKDPLIADAYMMKTAFFDLKSPGEALEFLKRSGNFTPDTFSITWAKLLEWQQYLKRQNGMRSGFGAPPEGTSTKLIQRMVNYPQIEIVIVDRKTQSSAAKIPQVTGFIHCDSVVEAIVSTIQLDRLRGVKSQTCPECDEPFSLEFERKDKKYCSHLCANSAGQKRRRSLLKKKGKK